jgi:hypothetical protein
MKEQSLENPFAAPFRISVELLVLLTGAVLSTTLPAWMIFAPIAAVALLWVLLKRPTSVLGLFLAWMPFEFLAIMSGRFFGLPLVDVVSKSKEPFLLLLILILWQRNGFRLALPDWFLLALFLVAGIHKLFGGDYYSFQDDFGFLLPYFAGRVTVLTAKQEQRWAKCAVWIVAALSAVGTLELFVIGPTPRTLLYLTMGKFMEIEQGGLTASFHGTGYTGLREAATMLGPPEFGALCMTALIIWWVYRHSHLAGGFVAAGLVCAVTRSAWLGAAVALVVLAVMMRQTKRLAFYAVLALALFGASIPVLGLSDYLFFTKTGQDPSAEWHRETILTGIQYVAEHPLGTGPGSIGSRALDRERSALNIETSYLTFGGEYGIAALLCFVGFLLSAFRILSHKQSRLSYAASGIIIGFSVIMIVLIMHTDFRLNCWVWFPVGLALSKSSGSGGQQKNTGIHNLTSEHTIPGIV